MGCSTESRSREHQRRLRSLQVKRSRDGWSPRAEPMLWVMDVELELLRNKMNQGREMVRQAKVEGMGERGRSRAHGRRRIRADALADMADSGELF
jgi:hypothetical protein